MLRDEVAIGAIAVMRLEPQLFPKAQVELLKTFAGQAVIAIENTRLFTEVQERTRQLSQSLEDLRAAQDSLVQTEKLAALGRLVAGVAHEINTPVGTSLTVASALINKTNRFEADVAKRRRAPVDPDGIHRGQPRGGVADHVQSRSTRSN